MIKLFKFVVYSGYFRLSLIYTIILALIFMIYRTVFDSLWESDSYAPLTNLYDVYSPPLNYDNIRRINIKLASDNVLAIEGNKKLRVIGVSENFDYFDSVKIEMPTGEKVEKLNKIFIKFEDSADIDSIYFMTAISDKKDIFWKQIFFSSVFVKEINRFSKETHAFRIHQLNLVDSSNLINNDPLINSVLNYFNEHSDTMQLKECGYNSILFKSVCERFSLPCRVISLQGGDAELSGYHNTLGYPLHALCEIYSSRQQKWHVIDPTYGLRFKEINTGNYLNAIEISNRVFFNAENDIYQDSVLYTMRTILGKDYFKYFENVIYNNTSTANKYVHRILKFLFNSGDNFVYQYSNKMPFSKNYYNYMGIKLFGYLLILIIHMNIILFISLIRLYRYKKPKEN